MDTQEVTTTKQDKGFTLVELLIVIVILGVLATVTVFAVSGISSRGETTACQADLNTLRTAAEAFYAEEGYYARAESNLAPAFIATQSAKYNYAGSGATAGAGAVGNVAYTITVQDTACPTP